ncbi:Vacuolar protein sorting-associated protein 8 [Penicillium rubens]|nr:Vacuolar protein sorting-associated protein 8 [Penicillium rubens]
MSSMAEGSEGWSREDELDLGQEDDPRQPDHGALDQTLPSPQEPAEEELDTIDDAEEHDSEKTARRNYLSYPETPPPRHADWTATGSVDGTGSNPDDSPSLHGSVPSSLSSSPLALRGSPRVSPSPARRPFDLRFQSRLSSSPQSVSRAGSPFLAHLHSRQSSITSQLSPTPETEAEPLQGPWEVVRWTKLRKITGQAFSEIGKRNFGRPTCLAVSTSIVIGTSKGIILVFDYQQSLKTIIGTGTPAVECGAVTSLALSADHSTVAGGHDSGDIFTWEISRSAKPFLHIPPIPANQTETRISDGHLSGSAVIHIGFLGTRRTALVSADTRGMSFSHLATRGMGAVGRTVKTTRILGRYPQAAAEVKRRKPSSVLAFSPLPLGNVEQPTDSLGLVAMLTPYLLVIVSTTPVAQTQHKAPRPKEVPAHSALTGALAWFPAIRLKGKDTQTSNTKLVYCWSNVLTVLEVSEAESDEPADKDKPPSLVFRARSRWRADEAIVAVQWLSRSVLAVFTITQRLLIIEDYSMHVTDSVDLANRHIYHTDLFSSQLHSLVEQLDEEDDSMHGVVADAFHMSFRSYKGRLFLLGYNEALVGNLSNWADRLLALMEAGDFIGAIRLATSYYRGESEKLTVGLPEEDVLRQPIVQEKLLEMISASLKYAFGRNSEASNGRLENQQLEELAEVSIAACVYMSDEEFLWEEVFNWYEEQDSAGIFLDALEPRIVDGTLRSLPPIAVKALINHFIGTHSAGRLEEIICLLDTTTMDIDQVTTLCKQHNLYDAFIYVWNRCLMDYVGPLEELLHMIPSQPQPLVNGDYAIEMRRQNNVMKMFPYLSFILTGRIYPTGDDMDEAEATRAKTDLYQFLFSGRVSGTVPGDTNEADSFSQLRAMLKFDASSFMSMLNEAFEDSFLNEPESEDISTSDMLINRQYLVSILLQVMTGDLFTPFDTIYLDMFVARNLPKYPQYILLSGTTLHQVLVRICQYPEQEMAEDCELSAEYLLSFYHPPDIQSMIPLFKEARFFRILKSTYRSEKQYPLLVMTYLEDPSDRDAIFTCLQDCLRPSSGLGKKQRRDVVDVVKEHAREIAAIHVTHAARTMQDLAPDTHSTFLRVLEDDPQKQYQYLLVLVEPQAQTADTRYSPGVENWMIERYVQLLCKYNPSHVADFVDGLRVGDIHLEELLPSIEESGAIDAAVILLARQGQVREALDRLVAHLGTLESGLVGILQSVRDSPDSATTAEAIDDLIESLNKYAGVGTWLCQGQTKTAKQSRTGSTNGKRNAPTLDQPLAFDELLWLDHIEAVVRIASNVFAFIQGNNAQISLPAQPTDSLAGESGRLTTAFRTLVQQVFTALLASTVKSSPTTTERTDISFLRILRAFLTRAATWSPSLLELRAVLASIFSAYSYEKSLLTLANGMLDRDLFVHVDEVSRLRQQGWRPRGHVCEICRSRIWGPSVGEAHWSAWEARRAEVYAHRIARRNEDGYNPSDRGKGKAADVGVGHMSHLDAGGAHGHTHVLAHREHGDRGGMSGANADHDHEHCHAEAGAGSSTATTVADSPPEPVVVFACRHLYHRRCVLDAISARARPAETAFRRDHLPDWTGAELFCPTCT